MPSKLDRIIHIYRVAQISHANDTLAAYAAMHNMRMGGDWSTDMGLPGNANLPLGGTIRQLRPSDFRMFRDHLLRLDAASRRDRFNGPAGDDFITAYAERSFSSGTTVVGYIDGGELLGAAELHERPEEIEPTAEIAFSVDARVQHRGIGSLLFRRLVAHARALGYTRLWVTTHARNEAMKRLARRFDARLTFEDGEAQGLIELDPLPGVGEWPARAHFDRPAPFGW